jgi:hypothetical protein
MVSAMQIRPGARQEVIGGRRRRAAGVVLTAMPNREPGETTSLDNLAANPACTSGDPLRPSGTR